MSLAGADPDRWSTIVRAWGLGERVQPEIDDWIRTGLLPDGMPGDVAALRRMLQPEDGPEETYVP
jgi:hypothetical protein